MIGKQEVLRGVTCEGLKRGSVIGVNELDHLTIGRDQNGFPIW